MVPPSIRLPAIGLGGGSLGTLSDDDAFALLDAATALGVKLIDVARSYGDAEDKVGRWLRSRAGSSHSDVVVVTKGGYIGDPRLDWTGAGVARGIDDAVRRLSRVDVFLLHSCDRRVLRRDDVGQALVRAVERGVVGAVGYAGDNDDLHVALDRAAAWRLSVIEQSLSLLDGKARVHTLPRARALGLQVIAKRALANCPWMQGDDDDRVQQRARFARARVAAVDVGMPFDELFLRFTAFTAGVSTVLVGTRRVRGLERAVDVIGRGPLPADVREMLQPALGRCDDDALV